MNTKTEVKQANYTPEMVAILTDAAPLNLEKAKALESVLNRSYKSIIAKAKSEGIEYHIQQPKPKRVGIVTKAQVVEKIEAELDAPDMLSGLVKAPASALDNLLGLIRLAR